MSDTYIPKPPAVAEVERAADTAYVTLLHGELKPGSMDERQRAERMQELLQRDLGLPVTKERRLAWPGRLPDVSLLEQDDNPNLRTVAHHYDVVSTEDGDVVVDPSWQDYLPAELRSDELEPVLVGTREAVVERFRDLGVTDSEILNVWKVRPTEGKISSDETRAAISDAARRVVRILEDEGIPRDAVHGRQAATRSAALLPKFLGGMTVSKPRRLAHVADDRMLTHHYNLVRTPDGDMVVDMNWQWLLPKDARLQAQTAPEILVGSPQEVIAMAQANGITDPAVLGLWAQRDDNSATDPSLTSS